MIAKLEQDSQSCDCKTRKTFKLFDVFSLSRGVEREMKNIFSLDEEFHTLPIKLPVDFDSKWKAETEMQKPPEFYNVCSRICFEDLEGRTALGLKLMTDIFEKKLFKC